MANRVSRWLIGFGSVGLIAMTAIIACGRCLVDVA